MQSEKAATCLTGVRPNLGQFSTLAKGFLIQDERTYGDIGLVNHFGIESLDLTSCFVIANEMAKRLELDCEKLNF